MIYSKFLVKNQTKRLLMSKQVAHRQAVRSFGVLPILGRILKLRYLFLGSAVGGGVAIHNKYENFRSNLPDLSWMKEFLPEDKYDQFYSKMRETYNTINSPQIGIIMNRFSEIRNMANNYLENLKSNTEEGLNSALADESGNLRDSVKNSFLSQSNGPASTRPMNDKERIARLQEELMSIQLKYQKELEKYEKENKEIKKQLLLQKEKLRGGKIRKIKKSLIDMYSEVLDELSEYDSAYNIQDHLPRVVVIGDQSAGKTSVLEMIAQARIFPRGAGEMMTKSPVKVTLSEGPYHVAQFKDSKREFDLTKESELVALRNEIELRMKNSVKNNQTISNEVISLSVKGPGLQRMVLVDLPGIISTETQGMAQYTKDSIQRLASAYMSNPNAIILCIQDGSIDAERSNVTDLVSKMDPNGKRTIFVMTKFDLAENNQFNPDRIKKILEGKLFPMKALGYFAVITGRGNVNDSIESIRDYEEEFFSKSRLFREGILLPNQMTTRNLSMAVSECFWKMVKESIEQQTDTYKATRFNLETEWKNTFPRLRELDRDELFEKARGEILDEVINLAQIKAKEWEDLLNKLLLEQSSNYIFKSIYMPAAQSDSLGSFNTNVDIKLRHWAEKQLPQKCVEVGTLALMQEFEKLINKDQVKKNHDNLLDGLKEAIRGAASQCHKWDTKAMDSLRVIQSNALEDRSVPDKQAWESAIVFMEGMIKEKLKEIQDQIKEFKGPSLKERWLQWKNFTPEQIFRSATINELEKLQKSFDRLKQNLDRDELTAVKKNLQAQKIDVDEEFINETWSYVYKQNFMLKKLSVCADCRNFFFYYQKGFTEQGVECQDVILFWRLKKMLNITANALRQQIVNIEVRRLEREIKEILDDYAHDKHLKKQLLTGKRVELAEELKRVRQIQEKLEEFIQALNNEKN
ncbi:dynamin-like 120 kDa mitochondrial-like protein [Brachionus plicatilis]|uniref:Dynamin-like GTPase OPA1, mitochondrial n=1 Tax=Brachionus plicatilis TaxID=10195 RepID=A0A3M7T6R5_BRAPC|nr:dynamin-like 120 kDa mitochondrial-like protein [Brachionus plicatilis]